VARKTSLSAAASGQAFEFPGRTGAERAATRLAAAISRHGPLIEGPPSRQVLRARARKADKRQYRLQRAAKRAARSHPVHQQKEA
jgi:hypothetical protein